MVTTDTAPLVQIQPKWTKQDYFLLTTGISVFFGHGVEFYLPGVVTQAVACELKVGSFQEGVLDCILYFALGVTTFLGGPLSERIGRRPMLLISLYTSCVSTIISAIVGSYTGLIISRGTIGLCAGLSFAVICAFLTERASNQGVKDAILLLSMVGYTCLLYTSPSPRD